MTLPGIDISNHQGNVDWDAIKASGVKFAFVKASERATYLDPFLSRNKSEMARVGITRGFYHFARPSINTADVEAAWFLKCVGPISQGDMMVLDMEDEHASGNLSDWTLRFLQVVEKEAAVKPLLYSGYWYMEPHGLFDERLKDYGLWYAAYQSTMPPAPSPWEVIAFWQYSSTGSQPGVSGHCDLDTFNGNEAQLALYGYQPAPAGESPQETIDRLRSSLRITADGIDDRAEDLERTAALLRQQAQAARTEADR